MRVIADQADRQVGGGLPQQRPADEIAIAIVDVGVVRRIIIETIALHIDAIDARRDRVGQRHVEVAGEPPEIIIAIGHFTARADAVEVRRLAVDADHARRRVAAAQRTLRATQNFDAVDFAELVEADARTRTIDAIDEHRDRAFEAGVVTDRTDAANTGRTVGFRPGRGNLKRRRELAQLTDVVGTRFFQRGSIDRGHRDGNVRQLLRAALRGDDDVVVVIVVGLRGRGRHCGGVGVRRRALLIGAHIGRIVLGGGRARNGDDGGG